MTTAKNIIFDYGNVLIDWDPFTAYAPLLGGIEQVRYFWQHILTAEWRNRIDAGEGMVHCLQLLSAEHPEYAKALMGCDELWDQTIRGEVPGMYEVVKAVKESPRYRLLGLSNWAPETFERAYAQFPVLQLFDERVISGYEGVVKPDPRIFQILVDRYGICPAESLFIDDRADNVAAAEALGFQGLVFENAQQVMRELF